MFLLIMSKALQLFWKKNVRKNEEQTFLLRSIFSKRKGVTRCYKVLQGVYKNWIPLQIFLANLQKYF